MVASFKLCNIYTSLPALSVVCMSRLAVGILEFVLQMRSQAALVAGNARILIVTLARSLDEPLHRVSEVTCIHEFEINCFDQNPPLSDSKSNQPTHLLHLLQQSWLNIDKFKCINNIIFSYVLYEKDRIQQIGSLMDDFYTNYGKRHRMFFLVFGLLKYLKNTKHFEVFHLKYFKLPSLVEVNLIDFCKSPSKCKNTTNYPLVLFLNRSSTDIRCLHRFRCNPSSTCKIKTRPKLCCNTSRVALNVVFVCRLHQSHYVKLVLKCLIIHPVLFSLYLKKVETEQFSEKQVLSSMASYY